MTAAIALAQLACVTALAQVSQPGGVEVRPLPRPAALGGAEIIYVDANASGLENGTSWSDAFKDLTDGIAAADTGDEIWVAMGTYRPTGMGGARTISFNLVNDVGIYGGFIGTETMRDERIPSVYLTTLSGDLNGDDGPGPFENNTENSFHVVNADGVSATAILDGFTITGGNANGVSPNQQGAGITMTNGQPTITDCYIGQNTSTGRGAGVFILNNSGTHSPTFRSCVFTGNVANETGGLGGGAIWSGSGFGTLTTNLIRCYVTLNTATGHGGGIVVSRPVGGVGTSQLNLVNSYVYGNTTDSDGGAIYIDVPSSNIITMTNCELDSNTALNAGGDGGGIYHVSGNLTVTNATITRCEADSNGGGINTSAGNFLIVTNSILWGNEDGGPDDESAQLHITGGVPNVSYSIVQGGWSGAGTNNLSSNPMFIDPFNYDNRVLADSPAVDSGNNGSVPQDTLDVDLDGNTIEPTPLGLGGLGRFADNPYVADTGNGIAPIVDRGAWEVRELVYLYVDEDGLPGTGDWAAAYYSLGSALEEARASANAEIWVADGTYRPTDHLKALDDRSASFQLRNHVAVYGGFAGDETMREERDPVTNVSILSGDLDGDDSANFMNYGDNSYHVVNSSGVDTTAVLDGFTIRGGNADGSSMDAFGGGIYNDGGTPFISQCMVLANRADTAGGGMYNTNGGNAELENVTFSGNDATIAGGGMDSFASNVYLEDCDFVGNTATFAGAMNNTTSSPTCERCEFVNNTADDAGGAVYNFGGSALFRNCRFIGNSAVGDGGGLLNEMSDPTVVECVFEGNYSGSNGAGIYNDIGSSMQLFNSRFSGNGADSGGGLYNNGDLTTVNCLFVDNGAVVGGAVFTDIANPLFVNCTFAGNLAASYAGLYSEGGHVTVANSILWGHCDKGGCQQHAQVAVVGGTIDINYSLIGELDGSLGGVGNFDADPLFVSLIDSDYRIQAGSPAIDAGSVPSVPTDSADLDQDGDTSENIPLGLDGATRFYNDPDTANTGEPDKDDPMVDIGAFEFLGIDCNQNNIPDNCDISCGMEDGPCDVPGCGNSNDLDMNGEPDECGVFSGDCPMMSDSWSCFDNWTLPGEVYPDNMGGDTYNVVLDNQDDVFLDVDVTIDSLVIKDEAKLRMTQTGSGGDLTIATDLGLKLMGTGPAFTQLLTAGNRMINLTCGPVTVLNAFYGPSPTAPPGSVNSILNCETLRITQPSGEVRLEDSMSINASVDLILDGRGASPCVSDGGKTTPIKRVFDNGSVNVGGDFSLQDNTNYTNASSVNMNVGGSFFNSGAIGDCFDCSQGGITLMGNGAQTFEVSGENVGPNMNGFVHPTGHTNFSWEGVEVTGGTSHTVRFQNMQYNGWGFEPCDEALYVRTLTLQAGSTITIDEVKVYYLNLVNNGATINLVGCGQLLPVRIACTMNQQCDDSAACTYDDCHMGFCRFTEVEYGNVNGMGPTNPNLDDILCVLAGFANMNSCTNGDIRGAGDAPCVPNNIISLDDILAVLGAFGGADLCGCVP